MKMKLICESIRLMFWIKTVVFNRLKKKKRKENENKKCAGLCVNAEKNKSNFKSIKIQMNFSFSQIFSLSSQNHFRQIDLSTNRHFLNQTNDWSLCLIRVSHNLFSFSFVSNAIT